MFLAPENCQCLDPVGAGDAFDAGFLSGILENHALELCGRMGAIAGAMVTETDGDFEGYPSRRKMDNLINYRKEDYR